MEMEEINQESYSALSIPGTLRVKYLEGKYGQFPVGTLISSVGQFTVRDDWLEAFDTGEYDGVFEVCELSLYTYRYYGESRTAIRAYIESYALNDYDDTVIDEPDYQPDPVEEDSQDEELEGFTRETHSDTADTADTLEYEKMLMSFLNGGAWWEIGDDYCIDSTIGRANIVKCRQALLALGYTFDPLKQTYIYNKEGV